MLLAVNDPPRHTKRAKLKIPDVLEIYDQRRKVRQIDLAQKYGVTEALINQIQNRKAWGWLLEWQRPR